MSVTRAFLRRQVGRLTRQMKVIRCTATGTTTTAIDAINLSEPEDSLLGRVGWVVSGTANNLYSTIRVTANDPELLNITFTPALTAVTAANDEIELWNVLDQGVTPYDVHDLINHAIESVADEYFVADLDDEQTFDKDAPVLDIPATWRWLEGVDWEDANGFWHPVPQRALRVDQASRTVEILYPQSIQANTREVRLRGGTRPASLSSDTSTTPVDAEYLINYVSYLVLLNTSFTNFDAVAMERKASTFKEDAAAARGAAKSRPQGLGIVLPL